VLRARDLMRSDYYSVEPQISMRELDEAFAKHGVSGFPVAVDRRPVGVVSRGDVLRCLHSQLAYAAGVGDFYRDRRDTGAGERPLTLAEEGAIAGARLAETRVEEIMTRTLISVSPDESLAAVARILVAHRVHRVLIVENWRLEGILSSTDLVRAVAEERLVPATPE
jgi:CBS domain-containing protein